MHIEEYPSYEFREKVKTEGWQKIFEATSAREKAFHWLHSVIWSHYWRAREHLESRKDHKTCLRKIMGKKYYPHYVLDIDHYTCHYLYAMREKITQDVLDCLKDEFHYEGQKCKFLPDYCTSYQFIQQ